MCLINRPNFVLKTKIKQRRRYSWTIKFIRRHAHGLYRSHDHLIFSNICPPFIHANYYYCSLWANRFFNEFALSQRYPHCVWTNMLICTFFTVVSYKHDSHRSGARYVIEDYWVGPSEMKNNTKIEFVIILNVKEKCCTNVLRWASFSSATWVCCGENFSTAAITLINVPLFEFMLFVKYLKNRENLFILRSRMGQKNE